MMTCAMIVGAIMILFGCPWALYGARDMVVGTWTRLQEIDVLHECIRLHVIFLCIINCIIMFYKLCWSVFRMLINSER